MKNLFSYSGRMKRWEKIRYCGKIRLSIFYGVAFVIILILLLTLADRFTELTGSNRDGLFSLYNLIMFVVMGSFFGLYYYLFQWKASEYQYQAWKEVKEKEGKEE